VRWGKSWGWDWKSDDEWECGLIFQNEIEMFYCDPFSDFSLIDFHWDSFLNHPIITPQIDSALVDIYNFGRSGPDRGSEMTKTVVLWSPLEWIHSTDHLRWTNTIQPVNRCSKSGIWLLIREHQNCQRVPIDNINHWS
jgi:hypothetical protein